MSLLKIDKMEDRHTFLPIHTKYYDDFVTTYTDELLY
jgi:hypothetical protein